MCGMSVLGIATTASGTMLSLPCDHHASGDVSSMQSRVEWYWEGPKQALHVWCAIYVSSCFCFPQSSMASEEKEGEDAGIGLLGDYVRLDFGWDGM